MDSRRAAYRRGAAIVTGCLVLVGAGAVMAWAARHGFLATLAVATFTALWVVVLFVWGGVRSVDKPSSSTSRAADGFEEERVLLHVLLDRAPGALLALEQGRNVRALNRAARQLFATDDRVLPVPPALLAADVQRLRHGGRSWRIDRVTVQDARAARTVVALVDVEAEEHAAEARATRELLRVLGHEVMNALAPVASLAESAVAVLDAPQARRDRLLPEILGTLSRRADGLRRFTEAYRQVARLPEPSLEPIGIPDLFAEIARLFEGEWQAQASLSLGEVPAVTVSLDQAQIIQALLALLRNGVEASAPSPAAVVRLAATAANGRLTFQVSDSGPGVDPANGASIFLPFFTTKPDGNGIGLAAARQIAQSHGGDVVLLPGAPTTFELFVPV
ncbi:sensor histidine kinase [Sphingomonas sp. 3-13AW]|uniref:sensor histidine kinase n=1 Tax=Sphingomonas sp. 3-13AW TaxID=3050450 RepID=UPI003BB7A1B2